MKTADHSPRLIARVEPDGETGAMRGKLHLYDQIGGFEGIRAKHVIDKLESLKDEGAKHLDVHIHSPGGDVHEGVAIHTAIAGWDKGEKHVHVDGLAASIASLIAMAGDRVTIAPHAMMMLHRAKSFMLGGYSSEDLRKAADRCDQQQGVLAKCYAEASGKSEDETAEMMKKETWLTAEDAVNHGFADGIEGDDDEDEDEKEDDEREDGEEARFRAVASALYSNSPPELERLFALNLPTNPITKPAASPPVRTEESAVTFDELKTKLANAEQSAATMQARAETAEKTVKELLDATGKTSVGEIPPMIAALKENSAKLAEYQAEIAKRDAEAAKAAEARKVEEIKAMLDEACKDGRLTPAKRAQITAAERPAFAKNFDKDPVALKSYLDDLRPIVQTATGAQITTENLVPKEPASVTLTAEDKKIIEASNLDPVLFALQKSDPSGQLYREELANRKRAAEAAAAAAKK